MKRVKLSPNRFVTTAVLQRTAGRMIPFYRRIALNQRYAEAWTQSVRKANLTAMERLLLEAGIDVTGTNISLSTNGIGYFLDFPAPAPINVYTNGTSLRPGTTQFYFNTAIHRSIARAVLPLYRKIVSDRVFAGQLVRAIRMSNPLLLNQFIRDIVTTRALRSVTVSSSGFMLGFKYPASRFTFYNQFFRETIG